MGCVAGNSGRCDVVSVALLRGHVGLLAQLSASGIDGGLSLQCPVFGRKVCDLFISCVSLLFFFYL